MHWIITRDLVLCNKALGIAGAYPRVDLLPTDSKARALEVKRRLDDAKQGYPYEFRLLDDDGEPYFEGVCGDINNAHGDEAFHPMDCFGSCGVTTMEYRKRGETEWRQL